jgi:GrpB-like predicted nucleotidyltransferase (UPF0157 family)
VPGLAAKDVIDIQVTIADLAVPIDAALAQEGFAPAAPLVDHCPPGMALAPAELAKRLFEFTARRANLHVRAVGRFNQQYPLLCRDYLAPCREWPIPMARSSGSSRGVFPATSRHTMTSRTRCSM